MKKSLTILLGMIISLFLIGLVCGEVRINEVEPNPNGTDFNNEWIELYSDIKIDLNGWRLINSNNDTIELNQIFNQYLIINLTGNWLVNSDEKVFLYNNETLINETDLVNDNENYQSWNYCDGSWEFRNPTPGESNNCTTPDDGGNNNDSEIDISIEWDEDDIINGEDFDIEVIVENLDEDKNYDVKVWIENEDDDRISETYDENDEWVSSNQYYNVFFEEEIDDNKDITLRIHEDYDDYYDDARIYLRIREEDTSDYIKEINEGIEILEPEEEVVQDDDVERTVSTNLPTTTRQVIRLGGSSSSDVMKTKSEDIKTQGNMIYQSKTEYIKKYAIFGFAFLCVGLSVFLIFKRL